uniref:Uncharacterized protein n=1 Tax=Anguilla anguilla TaxID=7936 RepID=A0A0E9VHF9_ANGAN
MEKILWQPLLAKPNICHSSCMKNSHLSGPFQAEFIFCKFDSDIYEFKCTFQD